MLPRKSYWEYKGKEANQGCHIEWILLDLIIWVNTQKFPDGVVLLEGQCSFLNSCIQPKKNLGKMQSKVVKW
jgi:hypothetical protein